MGNKGSNIVEIRMDNVEPIMFTFNVGSLGQIKFSLSAAEDEMEN